MRNVPMRNVPMRNVPMSVGLYERRDGSSLLVHGRIASPRDNE
jgi:hypothetical protein